jgi:hypothetical protein
MCVHRSRASGYLKSPHRNRLEPALMPWPSDTMNKFSAAVVHGKIWAGDRNGSIYELDGDRFNKIAESPPNNAGDVDAIVDCPLDDGLIVRDL